MAIDNLTYRDGSTIVINVDVPQKDISLERTKAGNVRTIMIKQYGIGLIRDELVVNLNESMKDSEGDPIPLPVGRQNPVLRDQDYINDVNAYSQNGAIAFAKLFIDVVLKQRLEQTRCYEPDGTFMQPVYFELVGTSPDNDPDFNNGSVQINILVDAGYTDLEGRFRQDGGAWSAYAPVTNGQVLNNLGFGTYDVQLRSAGTTLLIEPIETVSI